MPPSRDAAAPGPLRTPDGRYLVVRGRLWRATDPRLSDADRARSVAALADARRRLRRDADPAPEARARARADVDAAKTALGERGPVWWDDGAPDFNRHLAKNTPYAEWFAAQPAAPEPQTPRPRRRRP